MLFRRSSIGGTERKLIAKAVTGQELVCSDLDPKALSRSEDPDCTVSAASIRDLLIGRNSKAVDPRGIQIVGARITGVLDISGIRNSAALRLRNCWFDDGIVAHNTHLATVDLDGSYLKTFHADGLRIESDLLLRDHFTAVGGGDSGTLRLVGAKIGGNLDFRGAYIDGKKGSALYADRLQVEGDIRLCDEFSARSDSAKATIRLPGGHIGELLDLYGAAAVVNTAGPLLDFRYLTCRSIRMPAKIICVDENSKGKCGRRDSVIMLEGFDYDSLDVDGAQWKSWLHWLHGHTNEYTAQSYQHLAGIEKAAGHEAAARQILISQQQDLAVRGNIGGKFARIRHRMWGLLAGYDYHVSRVAISLLLMLLMASILGILAGHTRTGSGVYAAGAVDRPGACSTFEQILLGVDRGLPIAATGIRTRCDLNTLEHAGQIYAAAIWLVQLLIWVLATLAVAGYTGLIRKLG